MLVVTGINNKTTDSDIMFWNANQYLFFLNTFLGILVSMLTPESGSVTVCTCCDPHSNQSAIQRTSTKWNTKFKINISSSSEIQTKPQSNNAATVAAGTARGRLCKLLLLVFGFVGQQGHCVAFNFLQYACNYIKKYWSLSSVLNLWHDIILAPKNNSAIKNERVNAR